MQSFAECSYVKNSPENYEKFLFTLQVQAAKNKAATIYWWTLRQLTSAY